MNVVVIPAVHQAEDSDGRNANSDYQLNQQSGDFQIADAAMLNFPRNKNAIFVLFANDFCHLVPERSIKEGRSLVDATGLQTGFQFLIDSVIAQFLIIPGINQRTQFVPVGNALMEYPYDKSPATSDGKACRSGY